MDVILTRDDCALTDLSVHPLTILYTVKVITSPIRTDHKAIVATNDGRFTDPSKTRSKIFSRRRSPDHHASLLGSLRSLDVREFQTITDAQEAWNLFYLQALGLLDHFYPVRSVTITS